MKDSIKKIIDGLPYIKTLRSELALYKKGYPPGHFYSPVISVSEVRLQEDHLFKIDKDSIANVELNEGSQLQLLDHLAAIYPSIPFEEEKKTGFRYYFNNTVYTYSDAIFLHLMIRHYKPKRIIEIGSGFSSAVMLDTNEHFFNNEIGFTFIEPYPERLYSLFKPEDKTANTVFVKNLQDVDPGIFRSLEANDILFVDSTHVSKTGSDVNKIIFEILPFLKPGVLIHFHDIFYPFEYPKDWVMGWSGFGWNEAYILKAFLMNNDKFNIVMFNTYLEHFHKEWFRENMPLCLKNEGGSIWIQKVK